MLTLRAGKEKKAKKLPPPPPAADTDGDLEMAEPAPVPEEDEEDEEEEAFQETSASRVVLRILNHLIPFLSSKERGVRYRTAQFLALLLSNTLPTFPFDYSPVSMSIFKQVRAALIKRVQAAMHAVLWRCKPPVNAA